MSKQQNEFETLNQSEKDFLLRENIDSVNLYNVKKLLEVNGNYNPYIGGVGDLIEKCYGLKQICYEILNKNETSLKEVEEQLNAEDNEDYEMDYPNVREFLNEYKSKLA